MQQRTFEMVGNVEQGRSAGAHERVLGLDGARGSESLGYGRGDRLFHVTQHGQVQDGQRVLRGWQFVGQHQARVLLRQPGITFVKHVKLQD